MQTSDLNVSASDLAELEFRSFPASEVPIAFSLSELEVEQALRRSAGRDSLPLAAASDL